MAHEQLRPRDLEGAMDHLVEELGEAVAALGKTKRFGFMSVNPFLPEDQQVTNIEWLLSELEDVERAIENFYEMLV